jgi:hypothetical protein
VTLAARIRAAIAHYKTAHGRTPTIVLLSVDLFDEYTTENPGPPGRRPDGWHHTLDGIHIAECPTIPTFAIAHHHVTNF